MRNDISGYVFIYLEYIKRNEKINAYKFFLLFMKIACGAISPQEKIVKIKTNKE